MKIFFFLISFVYANESLLKNLEHYLDLLPTVKATFVQKNLTVKDKCEPVNGHLYLDRMKGKMRIDYPKLKQTLVVSKGTLYVADQEDVQVIDVDYTPAGLFLQKRIRFGKNVHVLGITESGDHATLTLSASEKGDEGSMAMAFQVKPFIKLTGWTVTDPQGNKIQVDLENFEAKIPLKDSLFVKPEIYGK